MTPAASAESGALRVLVLAPTGRDSEVIVQTLSKAGIASESCGSVAELCTRIEEGAGAALVAGETLATEDRQLLEKTLEQQPEWSDFPLVVMETARAGRTPSPALLRMASLSYALVLVRPVHVHTLVSAVHSALRSRSRQYQVRGELAERERVESALRESNERKDEFLAMLGHELRNPLAVIRNATQMIELAAPADERLRRAHGVLERQSAHMTRLMDGLLEVSRISRGKIHLDPETLDLRQVLEPLLQDRAPQIAARGITLHSDIRPDPVWVRGDRSRLSQVFDNLVANAIKFTDPPGDVSVALRQEDAQAVVRVLDTGIGIRPQMLERLFDPFQQEMQDIARASGGLGLGLALAKGLVELHGGTIRAHSAGRGAGAEFEVRLPIGTPPSETRASEQRAETVPRRVLVVEDNVDAGYSLCAVLEMLGHDVTLAETGADALGVLQSRGANIVLCDLGLPGMNGYQFAQAVRADPALRDIPLVAVTGYGQPEDRRRTAEAGFDGHVTKPFDVETLSSMLDRLGTNGEGIAHGQSA